MPCIIVLGGHRCGTSSIAGAIAHLGVPPAWPGDEIGPSPTNERGHFEDGALVRMHQRMLGPGGWRDPQPITPVRAGLIDRYSDHLQRRAEASGNWLVKDPRLCFLLPVLLERLRSLGIECSVICVTRSPAAAAESLRRRHRMSLAAAQRIAWLYEGARRAQFASLSTPPSRLVMQLDYDTVLNDRRAAVIRLAQFLELPPTNAAFDFLDPNLRHHC
jgi:hypothetical protein